MKLKKNNPISNFYEFFNFSPKLIKLSLIKKIIFYNLQKIVNKKLKKTMKI